jgi:hypothetical protein
MKYRKAIVLFLVLIETGVCWSQKSLEMNGSFWKNLSETQKIGLVQGYSMGYTQGFFEGKVSALDIVDPKKQAANYADALIATPKLNPNGRTFTQLADGINQCFKDFRNVQLPISACMNWTIRGLNGESDSAREQFLVTARKSQSQAISHPQ